MPTLSPASAPGFVMSGGRSPVDLDETAVDTVALLPVEPRLVLPPSAFDELVADLDAPARPNRLRDLLGPTS